MARGGGAVSGGPQVADFSQMQQALQFALQMKETKRQFDVDRLAGLMEKRGETWTSTKGNGVGHSAFIKDNPDLIKKYLRKLSGGGIFGEKKAEELYNALASGDMNYLQMLESASVEVLRGNAVPEMTGGEQKKTTQEQGAAPAAPTTTASTTTKTGPDGTKTVTEEVATEVPGPSEVYPSSQSAAPREQQERGALGGRPHGAAQSYEVFPEKPLSRRLEEQHKQMLSRREEAKKILSTINEREEIGADEVPKWVGKTEGAGGYGGKTVSKEKLKERMLQEIASSVSAEGPLLKALAQARSEEAQAAIRGGPGPVSRSGPGKQYQELPQATTPETRTVTRTVPGAPAEKGIEAKPEGIREALAPYQPSAKGANPRMEKTISILEKMNQGEKPSTTEMNIATTEAGKVIWKAASGAEDTPALQSALTVLNVLQKYSGEAMPKDNPALVSTFYQAAKQEDRRITLEETRNELAALEMQMQYGTLPEDHPYYQRWRKTLEVTEKELGVRLFEADVRRQVAAIQLMQLRAKDLAMSNPDTAQMYKLWEKERSYFNDLYQGFVKKNPRAAFKDFHKLLEKDPELKDRYDEMLANGAELQALTFGTAPAPEDTSGKATEFMDKFGLNP